MAHEFDRKKLEKDLDDLEKLITHRGMSARGALATLSMQFIAGAYDVAPSERAQGVLLPRFTRDEAIALCKAPRSVRFENADGTRQEAPAHRNEEIWALGYDAGMRAALEALAAAGVFVDCNPSVCPVPKLCAADMSDKLDAAGIK